MSEAHPARGATERPKAVRTLGWTSSTYFGEGLPWSVLHQVASEYLTAIGVRPVEVGYTAWLHGATMLKFLWSPVVDLFGSLRQWMVATQVAMGILVGGLALLAHRLALLPRGQQDTDGLWLVLVSVGVLSATYDIACDGYYMAALGKQDQARYSGVRVAAFRAAMIVGSSGLVVLGGLVNWLCAFGVAAGLLLGLGLLHQRVLVRPSTSAGSSSRPEASATRGDATNASKRLEHIKSAYLSFLGQPKVLLVIGFLMTYKMADVLKFSMSKVLFARELGVSTDVRGALNLLSIGASILGAMLGGAWIARRPLGSTLFRITLVMTVTEPLFVALAVYAPLLAIAPPGSTLTLAELDWTRAWPGLTAIALVIVIEQVCGGMATAAQMVFIMRRCDPEHRAAHYAFATAVYSTSQMLVGGTSGALYEALGPVSYFWIVSALALPALVLSRLVPTERDN